MNIEAYNLDSLRKLVRKLQAENRSLKEQLEAANIPFDTEDIFEEKIENTEEYDPDQGCKFRFISLSFSHEPVC